MPLSAFPSRYRSKSGPTPLLSPAKLTPLGNDDLPMLRQDTEDSNAQSNETPNTYGPPPIPQPRAPIPFRTSFHKELAKPQTIEAPKPHASFSGIKGLMPPPGIKRHALGDIVGLNGPELGIVGEDQPEAVVPVSTDPTALPPLDNPEAPANTAPGGEDEGTVAPPTTAAPPNNIPAEPTPSAPVGATQTIPQAAFPDGDTGTTQTIPPAAFPGTATTPTTSTTAGVKTATDKLRDLTAPDRPDSNWAQRLGLAALALTKFAPVANQLIHPKWTQDQNTYLAQQADLERRQKEEETAASTEAQVEQREAAAQKANESLANTKLITQQRLQAAEDRIKAQTSETNRKFLADRLKGREGDSVYQPQTATMPPGYEFIPDPGNAGYGFASPPAWRQAPPEIAPFLAVKPGDMISHSDYVSGVKALQAQQLEGAKAGNKTDPAGAQKTAFQQTLAKIAASHGGSLPPGALTDPRVISQLIHDAPPEVIPPDEKAQAQAFLATNNTPASTNAAGVNRMSISVGGREQQVINKETGELEFRNPEEINSHPGLYMPAAPGAQAMSKQAVFQDLHYNINTARKAIAGLGTMDAGTRAQLALALGDTDPRSALQTWMRGEVAQTMTPQQQEAVQALAQLNENAMAIRPLAGMGQGAQDMRDAIRNTIPSGKSPSTQYMQQQLDKFENIVARLEHGVPKVNAPKGNAAPGVITVVAPDNSVHQFATQAAADNFKKLAHIK